MTLTPTGAPPAPHTGAPRRSGWTEAVDRTRGAATTEPGRLRIMGAVLVLLVVAFGAVTAWQVTERADAAQDVATRTQPLSADAANIYRYLADADTTASTGFLSGGQEPAKVAQRYQDDISTASALIAHAAADSSASGQAQSEITILNRELPFYTGLVESARADNRQGLPLGSSYLRYANSRMSGVLLPAAQRLYQVEEARLGADYGDSKSVPWLAWSLGLIALAGLGWAQRRTFLRTNRVVNHGMAGATAATVVLLLWLVVGHTVARVDLEDSVTHGATSLKVLNQARFDGLQARGDENLALVALGGDTAFEGRYQALMAKVAGPADGRGGGGLLASALSSADDSAGSAPVKAAAGDVARWRGIHTRENARANDGDYSQAVGLVIAPSGSTDQAFQAVDDNLDQAIGHETDELQGSVSGARDALTGLPQGAALLCLLGAAAAVVGIGRRLSEYR
ncbi:hypothetical protein [Streptantibioticus silvisoli]|uniref:Secreted protein n=1 Tax=Streptantibioticus silvisoli TaxID=2705255 RepID=A0ABT6WAH4_9ACTN|nr:hypothetical protein [Streptantibioticus silvisoli]MDI5967278.1 hypothetical protein [Streptantibioticus silvisoli]